MARNPLKDEVAIVGLGSTPYGRDIQRSWLSLGLEAALKAIDDAGIDRQEIDGIVGTGIDRRPQVFRLVDEGDDGGARQADFVTGATHALEIL